MHARRILLTGATGFVGRAVWQPLAAAGWTVHGLTRNAARARARRPTLEWREGDVGDGPSCERALAGCDAALYLVHSMGEGRGFHSRELAAAGTFARAAGRAGVRRIVYLGGVAPSEGASEHLRSRLDVGAALRAGPVETLELRASMIIGHGSQSWLMVRDLAARLPVMVLPRWLSSRTQPVAIDDVTVALVRALNFAMDGSAWFDLPGPEVLSGKEILEQAAGAMGLPAPRSVSVPLLSPALSSLWIRLVTRARWTVARELVTGLTGDVLAKDARFWEAIGHESRQPFREAARRALEREARGPPPGGTWAAVERAVQALGHSA